MKVIKHGEKWGTLARPPGEMRVEKLFYSRGQNSEGMMALSVEVSSNLGGYPFRDIGPTVPRIRLTLNLNLLRCYPAQLGDRWWGWRGH